MGYCVILTKTFWDYMRRPQHDPDDFSFWKKVIFISTFFLITPIALITTFVSLFSMNSTNPTKPVLAAPSARMQDQKGVQVFASLPSDRPSVSGQVLGTDARTEMLRQYLHEYDSPLEPYAGHFVEMADKYDLDYRLLVAIARKESSLGKRIPSSDCNNGWGWGVHSKGTLCFDSWEEGIETVAKGLKENYTSRGLVTPEEIMSMWVPHSPGGEWAIHVNHFMQEME